MFLNHLHKKPAPKESIDYYIPMLLAPEDDLASFPIVRKVSKSAKGIPQPSATVSFAFDFAQGMRPQPSLHEHTPMIPEKWDSEPCRVAEKGKERVFSPSWPSSRPGDQQTKSARLTLSSHWETDVCRCKVIVFEYCSPTVEYQIADSARSHQSKQLGQFSSWHLK